MERKEIISKLVQNGAELVKKLKVKNVTVTPQESYVRVALSFDKPVKGMITNDDGATYQEGETKVIFVSIYSITSVLRDNDKVAFAVNHIIKNPDSLSVILSGATVEIIQEKVTTGQIYKNPWSDNAEEQTVDHDTYYNSITDIKLSQSGEEATKLIARALLGFGF